MIGPWSYLFKLGLFENTQPVYYLIYQKISEFSQKRKYTETSVLFIAWGIMLNKWIFPRRAEIHTWKSRMRKRKRTCENPGFTHYRVYFHMREYTRKLSISTWGNTCWKAYSACGYTPNRPRPTAHFYTVLPIQCTHNRPSYCLNANERCFATDKNWACCCY